MPYKDKEKQREFQRLWVAKRRQDFFRSKVCVECGGRINLELHHKDPAKKVDHRIWS